MQRIFNVDKWHLIAAGQAVNFENTEARRVRIHVNAPDPVKLYYADNNGDVTFLARVVGRDVVEFGAYEGGFAITAEGGDCWIDTVDGENFSFVIPDAVILTRIAERRVRNPEIELMNYLMNQNIERRLNAQRDELVELWNRQQAATAVPAAQPAPSGDGGAAGSESQPDAQADGQPEPVKPAAK